MSGLFILQLFGKFQMLPRIAVVNYKVSWFHLLSWFENGLRVALLDGVGGTMMYQCDVCILSMYVVATCRKEIDG